MRVLIVNTSERTGGAAVAANRLMEALNNHGVKAKMLVREKEGLPGKWQSQWHFLWERLVIYLHLRCSRKHLFEIDIANAGTDITSLPEFQEADVVHLHWINQGMLSLGNIRKILRSGKPVVWTMHDIWPATAICHYSRGCKNYATECRNCQLLPHHGGRHDLANRVWRRKQKMLQGESISYVTCSQWLAGEAKTSALLKGQKITSIPNTINTCLYSPGDKEKARQAVGLPADKKIILFVSQRVTDQRKGMDYLVASVRLLAEKYPEMQQNVAIAILGGHSEDLADQLTLPVYPLGYVNDERLIVNVYRAADVFVTPSLEDNLPNTIMESLACGVPCIGFKVGGIPEMIDHQKNGYVAAYRDAEDLTRGLHWVLCEANQAELVRAAVQKVSRCYSQQRVALKYTEVYNEAIAQKHYKI